MFEQAKHVLPHAAGYADALRGHSERAAPLTGARLGGEQRQRIAQAPEEELARDELPWA